MSKLYTAKDLEKMIEQGKCLSTIPANAKLTPMARDILRKAPKAPASAAPAAQGGSSPRIHNPILPDAEYSWKPGGDPKTAGELEKFFYSPEIQA
ncbi:MAG: class II aldolase/adducin family protein, partial [Opitutales bacterium]|nr:class II aldolase/adducin family protein [Opitutales bacterium]